MRERSSGQLGRSSDECWIFSTRCTEPLTVRSREIFHLKMEWGVVPGSAIPLPKQEVTSDASGSWGCGAWWEQEWFQLQRDQRSQHLLIVEKELLPIVLAGATWGRRWCNDQVICHCDNMAVVACLRSRSSKVKGVMHLLRCLIFVEAHFQFIYKPQYINTVANHLADDLSRNHLPSFLSKVPHWQLDSQSSSETTSGPAPRPHNRMDLSSLSANIGFYFQQGLAPSKRKSYQAAL